MPITAVRCMEYRGGTIRRQEKKGKPQGSTGEKLYLLKITTNVMPITPPQMRFMREYCKCSSEDSGTSPGKFSTFKIAVEEAVPAA
jgi:hypothetical protein